MHYLYVIQAGTDGPCKVGASAETARRIKELSCPLDPEASLRVVWKEKVGSRVFFFESEVHRRLERYLIRKEWFNITPEQAITACNSVRDDFSPGRVNTDPELRNLITQARRKHADSRLIADLCSKTIELESRLARLRQEFLSRPCPVCEERKKQGRQRINKFRKKKTK